MAKKRSIRGIDGKYENYEIWRFPLGTMRASLRNPYSYKNIEGNIVRFINNKTSEEEDFFIPAFVTMDVLDVFNDDTKTDVDLYECVKKLGLRAQEEDWRKQIFSIINE